MAIKTGIHRYLLAQCKITGNIKEKLPGNMSKLMKRQPNDCLFPSTFYRNALNDLEMDILYFNFSTKKLNAI